MSDHDSDHDAVYLEAHARLRAGDPLESHHERVLALVDHAPRCHHGECAS